NSRGVHDETLGQVLQHPLRFGLRELDQVAGADGDRFALGILRSLGGTQDLDVALVEGITFGGGLPRPAVAALCLMPAAVVHAQGLGGVEAAVAALLLAGEGPVASAGSIGLLRLLVTFAGGLWIKVAGGCPGRDSRRLGFECQSGLAIRTPGHVV